jgi:hypothetical protein
MDSKRTQWVLRIAVAGEFLGHGMLALGGKADWITWIGKLIGTTPDLSTSLLWWIGIFDIVVALIVLIKPINAFLLWAVLWGFWTALLRPIMGIGWWDFVERFANWGAPLALLLLRSGWPKNAKQWFS